MERTIKLFFFTIVIKLAQSLTNLGCYKDTWTYRTLDGFTDEDMDPNGAEYCGSLCIEKGFRYAGTEYETECHCGHEIRKGTMSSGCTYECKGNREEYCGGSNRIIIYDTWHCAAEPCQNNGTCTDIDANHYTCSCNKPWTGEHCEQENITTTTTATPTTAKYLVITGSMVTTPDTNTTSESSLSDKESDDKEIVTTYAVVACVVIAILIAVVVVFLVCRRKKSKAYESDEIELHRVERRKKGRENSVSTIDVDRTSHRTTLYSNDHVLMTAEGEHINIEFIPTSTHESGDYNVLCLSGSNTGSTLNRPQCADENGRTTDSMYSHLAEPGSSDTYSRMQRSKHTKGTRLHDSIYSHVTTGSAAGESVSPTDPTYNSLNRVPHYRDRKQNDTKVQMINSTQKNNAYDNAAILVSNSAKQDNHIKQSNVHIERLEADKAPSKQVDESTITSDGHNEDNIYAQVVKTKTSALRSEDVPEMNTDDSGFSKMLYANTDQGNAFDEESDYYNM